MCKTQVECKTWREMFINRNILPLGKILWPTHEERDYIKSGPAPTLCFKRLGKGYTFNLKSYIHYHKFIIYFIRIACVLSETKHRTFQQLIHTNEVIKAIFQIVVNEAWFDHDAENLQGTYPQREQWSQASFINLSFPLLIICCLRYHLSKFQYNSIDCMWY